MKYLTARIAAYICQKHHRIMKKKERVSECYGGDIERCIMDGTRRNYPAVAINYIKHENWDKGRVYIEISRDSECMSADNMEVFIAMFRKVIEIARRKTIELDAIPDDNVLGEMPQIEMNYDNAGDMEDHLMYFINERGGELSPNEAEQFAELLETLMVKGREIVKYAAEKKLK